MSDAEWVADLRRREPKKRLSVSVPADLAKWAREVAQRNDVTISAVVELAVRKAQRQDAEKRA